MNMGFLFKILLWGSQRSEKALDFFTSPLLHFLLLPESSEVLIKKQFAIPEIQVFWNFLFEEIPSSVSFAFAFLSRIQKTWDFLARLADFTVALLCPLFSGRKWRYQGILRGRLLPAPTLFQ
jgi:hypothetical protein